MTGNRAFLLSAVLVLPVGCAGARDPAGTPGAPPATVTWAIQEDPLAVRLSSGGRPLVTFASAGRSAFYLYDQDTGDRVDLTGPVETLLEGGRTTLGLRTRDGRKASVTLEPGPEGSARVAFEAGALKPSERPSADLGVDPTEGFYGLMERVVQGHQDESWAPGTKQGLDLRGQTIELVVLPTVSLYSPFFVSSAGYGVLVDSDWPGVYDMGATAPGVVSIRYEGPDLPFVVFPGPGPAAAQARYARAVGTTILPPEWAFGPWRWRDDHVHMPAYYDGTPATAPYNSQVVEDVLMMEALGIPCSVYWVDRPWGPGDFGYDDLEWDTTRFPRPVDMIDWLAGRDIRFLLWIVDWAVGPKMLPEAESRGYLVGAEWPSQPNARLIDLTLPAAVEWWQDALVERIGDGLAGFKCDRGEEKEPDGIVLTGQYADGTSFREGRNANPRWYAAAVHGALERAAPEGGYVSIFRAGWRGSQQHTVFWGGDTASGPWGLRSAIIAMQRAAAMHFPIWGSDTCGYLGTLATENCMRWLAFSAFSPLMEVGPTGNVAPWSWPSTVPGEYTSYEAGLVAAWIFYARLHDDLRAYSYAQARLAHEDGTPFVRPMVFGWPERPEYRDLWDQYLYGPDILVAPVWQDGVTARDVHVPPGTWVDAWTREAHEGPAVVTLPAPVHRIPILVRRGASVDLGDLAARWADAQARAAIVPDLGKLEAAAAFRTQSPGL